jgi:hypothetical protein
MTAAHFIYIPSILLLGIVIGWILGSRAAADAYAVQARRSSHRNSQSRNSQSPTPNSQSDSGDRTRR